MVITPNAPNYFKLVNDGFASFQLIQNIELQIQFNKLQYLTENTSILRGMFSKVYQDMSKLFKLQEGYKATSGIKIYSKEWSQTLSFQGFTDFLKMAYNFRPKQTYIQDHYVNFRIIKMLQDKKLNSRHFIYKNQQVLQKSRVLLNPVDYPNSVLASCVNNQVDIIHCGGGGISPLNQHIRKKRLDYFYKEYYA